MTALADRTARHAVGGFTPAARWVPSAVLAAVAAGAVSVLLLWVHDTPPVLHGAGDYLTGAGRILGLLAGYAVVVQVVLMTRIPLLELRVGADRLARWHAFGGRYTLALVLGHALLITWGYAVSAHQGIVSQAGILITSYPDVLMATVAAGLLVAIGVTSMRMARRKLRYETWYYLHFYTYLAIALAFSHQFATGADFMRNPPARVLWGTMYGVAAALVLWYRIAVPVRTALRHPMRVHSVRRETADVYSVVISGDRLEDLGAEPGQFLRWRFLTRDGWWQSHPYSLSAPVHAPYARITVKAVGDHSGGLRHLRPGTRVIAEGPYGALTGARRSRRKVLLLAGGVGITPLRALFETLPAGPGELTLLYRARRRAEVVFADELEQIAADRGARVRYLLGRHGRRDPLSAWDLLSAVPDLRSHDVYLCGPPGMTEAAVRGLRKAGVPRRHIHHESFDW